MKKEQLQRVVEVLNDDFELDELFERLAFIQSIEEAQKSLNEGQGIPHEDVVHHMRVHIQNLSNGNNLVSKGS